MQNAVCFDSDLDITISSNNSLHIVDTFLNMNSQMVATEDLGDPTPPKR